MAGLDRQAVILNAIDSLRSRKARPDFERICHMVERRYGLTGVEVITELNRLVDEDIVVKVDYKGNTSYRNAAKWCKTRHYGSKVNSNGATRSILAAIEKITSPDIAKQGQVSEDAENPNADHQKESPNSAREGASLEEIEKFFSDENPETKFVRSFLEEALKREVGAKRLFVSPNNKYVLAKYAVSSDEKLDGHMKRELRPSKRKRFKKTHGPDFEQEPVIKTSTWDQRCDYCTLPASCNKFGDKEELLVCKDCAVKVHPSCMKYSRQLAERSRLSPWQCMHCKTCHVCNDAGDWETLLFCDSCDKGYHMACHNPKVEDKPQGKWVCELCSIEDMDVGSNFTDEDSVISSLSGSMNSNLEAKPDTAVGNGSSQASGQSTPDVATPNQSRPANLPLQSAQSQTPSTSSLPSPKTTVPSHPVSWSLDDVVSFLSEKGFKEQAETFRDQEIDGHALLLLRRSDVLTGLSFKLGPALKIYKIVSKLQLSQAKDSPTNSKTKSSLQTTTSNVSSSSSSFSSSIKSKPKPSTSSTKAGPNGSGKRKASTPTKQSSPPDPLPSKPVERNKKSSPPKDTARAKSISPKSKAEPATAITPTVSTPPAEATHTDSKLEVEDAIQSSAITETPPKIVPRSPRRSNASSKQASPQSASSMSASPKTPSV